jgi:hypothetical protein
MIHPLHPSHATLKPGGSCSFPWLLPAPGAMTQRTPVNPCLEPTCIMIAPAHLKHKSNSAPWSGGGQFLSGQPKGLPEGSQRVAGSGRGHSLGGRPPGNEGMGEVLHLGGVPGRLHVELRSANLTLAPETIKSLPPFRPSALGFRPSFGPSAFALQIFNPPCIFLVMRPPGFPRYRMTDKLFLCESI